MPTAQTTNTSSVNPTKKQIETTQLKSQQNDQIKVDQAQGLSGNSGNKTPQEQPEFIKQALILIEKKVRNLEKRRQKLEEYKESQRKGTPLNEDQLCAVSRFDEVLRTLELTREMEKQFISLANDAAKQQKRQSKKEQIEREEAIKEKLKEAQRYFSLLDTFGDEKVRNDFLNETNGAFKLSENEINLLDEFNKLVQPCQLDSKLELSLNDTIEHLLSLIDGKNKQINTLNTQITYLELKKLFDRILVASYWTQEAKPIENVPEVASPETVVNEQATEPLQQLNEQDKQSISESAKINPTSPTSLNNENQQATQIEQTFNQQNTSDDFVIVSTNDVDKQLQQQSPSQQQNQQTKTFFTTLNPADLPVHRNINDFLNRCQNNDEGINFLQDSEISSRPQEQQQLQNSDNFQSQQQFINQEYNSQQTDQQKDNQFKSRGGNRGDYNGSNRNYPSKPRYSDERRSGGTGAPRQHNNNGPRNMSGGNGNFGGNQQNYNNGGRSTNGGNSGNYRGTNTTQSGNNRPANNYYRQPNSTGTANRNPTNYSTSQQQPRSSNYQSQTA